MKKNKHDHKGTKALKLTLFFTLMLAPLLAIAVKCGYVMFNKNAYLSYSKQEIEQNYRVENISQYASGLEYTITRTDTPPTSNGNYRALTYISLTAEQLNISQAEYNTITKWILLNNGQIIFCDDNNSWITRINFGNESATIESFNFIGEVGTEFFSYIITYTKIGTQPIDNAFYYAVDEMQNSELFNWTTNTLMYSPIQAMTNGMGITTPSIAILVCYWLYLTAIYIVIDIVVETFTCITHMITNKLAE